MKTFILFLLSASLAFGGQSFYAGQSLFAGQDLTANTGGGGGGSEYIPNFAWWPLQENTGVVAANTVNAPYIGTLNAANWEAGHKAGVYAASLNGSSDYIHINDAGLSGSTSVTVIGWVKLVPGSAMYILGGGGGGITFVAYPGDVLAFYQSQVGGGAFGNDSTPSSGWCQVAVTFNQSQIRFYINGVPDSGNPYATAAISFSSSFDYIGRDGGSYSQGAIENVKISNTIATDAEILADYNATK
jgi:hypothetical protein